MFKTELTTVDQLRPGDKILNDSGDRVPVFQEIESVSRDRSDADRYFRIKFKTIRHPFFKLEDDWILVARDYL